jgi:hypothetical protein
MLKTISAFAFSTLLSVPVFAAVPPSATMSVPQSPRRALSWRTQLRCRSREFA